MKIEFIWLKINSWHTPCAIVRLSSLVKQQHQSFAQNLDPMFMFLENWAPGVFQSSAAMGESCLLLLGGDHGGWLGVQRVWLRHGQFAALQSKFSFNHDRDVCFSFNLNHDYDLSITVTMNVFYQFAKIYHVKVGCFGCVCSSLCVCFPLSHSSL